MASKISFVFIFLILSTITIPFVATADIIKPSTTIYLKTFEKSGNYMRIPTISMVDSVVSYQDTKDFYQFNVTLSKMPKINVFNFPIETKGLDFLPQPPLYEELDPSLYDFVNATHAIRNGEVIVNRPENIVNSVAVYYAGTNRKFGHWYTPLLVDAKGNTQWAKLVISETSLSVVADRDWLAKAVYPVVIDPTFGYTTVGGTSSGLGGDQCIAGANMTSPADAVNVTYISAYIGGNAATTNGTALIYTQDASNHPKTLLATSNEVTSITTTAAMHNFTIPSGFTTTPNAVYWVFIFSPLNLKVYLDANANYKLGYSTGGYTYPTAPNPYWGNATNPTFSGTNVMTIFANYESGDSTAPAYSSLTTSSTVCGASCSFGATFNDETDLTTTGGYIFSTNNTGIWANDTWTAFATTPETVSVSKTLKNTYADVVSYNWYFNDTAGNWNSTGIQSITLTADTYTVVLSTVNPSPSLGETITIDIAVSRAAGVSVSSWTVDISKTGAEWGVDYGESSFAVSEDSATTHTFNVTSLYDADCGATVTPVCAGLSVTWSASGGGGGGGVVEPEVSPSPTPYGDDGGDGGEFEFPDLTQDDYTNIAIIVVIVAAGFLVALLIVNRKPSRKSPRKQKSQLGRRKPRRESLL